jgi:hypothetical protein
MTRSIGLALLTTVLTCSLCYADDNAQNWLRFFEGTWKREREITVGNGEKVVETASVRCAPAAGGRATVSKGKWDESGAEWVMIAGCTGDKGICQHGVDSTNLTWSAEFNQVGEDTLSGKMSGMIEGQKFTGTSKIVKTGKNSFTVTWTATLATGEVLKGTAKNTRVAAATKAQ